MESFICSAFIWKTPFTQDLNQQNFTGLMSPSMAYKELDRLMSILTQETYQSSAKHWRAGRSLPVPQVHRHSLTLVLHVDMASLRGTWYHSHWTNHTASSSNRNIHQGLLIFTKLQGLGPAAPQGQPSSCTHWEHCRVLVWVPYNACRGERASKQLWVTLINWSWHCEHGLFAVRVEIQPLIFYLLNYSLLSHDEEAEIVFRSYKRRKFTF